MRAHTQDTLKAAFNDLSTAQLLALAVELRALWRSQVATGKMQFDPNAMRKYDADIAELRALHKQER
jgi:hypothetical protein